MKAKGVTMTPFGLAWVMAQRGVTSPIIGPNSVVQLEENLASLAVRVTDEDCKAVDALIPPGTNTEDYYRADFGPYTFRV